MIDRKLKSTGGSQQPSKPTNRKKTKLTAAGNRWQPAEIGLWAMLILAALVWAGFRHSAPLQTFSITFISIILEALPFILLGSLLSGLIEVYLPSDVLTRWVPKNLWLATLLGGGMGLLMPMCECGSVPVIRRLLHKGFPLGAGIAFLLAGPIVNPLVIFSTWAAYPTQGWMVVYRIAGGYAIAIIVGAIIEWLYVSPQNFLAPDSRSTALPCDAACGSGHPRHARFRHAIQHAAADGYEISRYFVIGAIVAAVMQTFLLRRGLVLDWSQAPALSIFLMMGLAVMLNLCSEADAFVAASFQSSMIPVAAQLAFLLLGPMLDLKLFIMYTRVFKQQAALTLSGLILIMVLGSTMLLSMVLP